MSQSQPKTSPHGQRRKTARTALPGVACELWVVNKKSRVLHNATMRDIGAGGTLVRVEQMMEVGQNVLCKFKLPAGARHSLRGKVVRCSPSSEEPGFYVAVAFSATRSGEKELMRWVLGWVALQQRDVMGIPSLPA